ncbi:hypothetical protein BZA77DRAFT_300401 [Pyronema omphalodes]|nr:hypothetical protein BZA77DRAFT_300401 [Pyronema omphalodes]
MRLLLKLKLLNCRLLRGRGAIIDWNRLGLIGAIFSDSDCNRHGVSIVVLRGLGCRYLWSQDSRIHRRILLRGRELSWHCCVGCHFVGYGWVREGFQNNIGSSTGHAVVAERYENAPQSGGMRDGDGRILRLHWCATLLLRRCRGGKEWVGLSSGFEVLYAVDG